MIADQKALLIGISNSSAAIQVYDSNLVQLLRAHWRLRV